MRIIGIAALADAFGVSHQAIANWQDEGMPVAVRGGANLPSEFELVECIDWSVRRALKRIEIETPRDRVFRLQGDVLEDEIRERRALLVQADHVEPRVQAGVQAAQSALDARRPQLARSLDGLDRRQREATLREQDRSFLEWLARHRIASKAQAQ